MNKPQIFTIALLAGLFGSRAAWSQPHPAQHLPAEVEKAVIYIMNEQSARHDKQLIDAPEIKLAPTKLKPGRKQLDHVLIMGGPETLPL